MKRILSLVLLLLMLVSLTACGNKTELKDGYYTAQAAEFSQDRKSVV